MFSDAPEDFKELVLKEIGTNRNQQGSNYRQVSRYVNTIFLNVDELE